MERSGAGGPELAAAGDLDLAAAETWVREAVEATGPFELVKARPWAAVYRVPTRDGSAYFKACRPVQAFEPRLTATLARRWPDRVVRVLRHDPTRSWLLTEDAGASLDDLGNPPERWLEILPRYAELQRGEASRSAEHVAGGVPDLAWRGLAARFEAMLARRLPLDAREVEAARALRPNLDALVAELAEAGIPDTIEHADLHHRSVFASGSDVRILDWGDASISHPFFSLVVTFHWLASVNGLAQRDAWFGRLRDAYLEPWGAAMSRPFAAALRLGRLTRALSWLRHHEAMGPGAHPPFDAELPNVLRSAIGALRTTLST